MWYFSFFQKLDHPNIIKFKGILHENDYLLVMEFMEQGQLHSYLNIHKDSITTQNLLKYALDIANVCEFEKLIPVLFMIFVQIYRNQMDFEILAFFHFFYREWVISEKWNFSIEI